MMRPLSFPRIIPVSIVLIQVVFFASFDLVRASTLLGVKLDLPMLVSRLTLEPDWTLGGTPTRLIPVPTAAPFGSGACPGVRPGGIVQSEQGQCTLNFLFEGSDGRRYIGTAGHCLLGDSEFGGDAGEISCEAGEICPEAFDAAGMRIGEFAYAVLESPKDFALVRLDPGVDADPSMCHFGAPAGLNDDLSGEPVVLHYFGNGRIIGDLLPARSALALGTPHPDHVFAQGVALPGDSGAGVLSGDGRALGVLVTVGVHGLAVGTGGVDAGTIGITRITPQIARAQEVLGIGLESSDS